MPARNGYLYRALRRSLSLNERHITVISLRLPHGGITAGFYGLERLFALQKFDYFFESVQGVDLGAVYKARFAAVARGNYEALEALASCRYKHGKYALRGTERTVERELAEQHRAVEICRQLSARLQYAYGEGQIVMRPLFFDVRGSEVYRNFVNGKYKRAVFYSRTHPFLAFLYGGVGKPDNVAGNHSLVYVCLDLYGYAFEPSERKACYL